MNDIQQKWIDALRSGEYKQGVGALRSSDGKFLCCLGVLCNIVAPDDWVNEIETDGTSYWMHRGEVALPNVEITNLVEIPKEYNHFPANLNDAHNYSFEQISDVLEHYFNTGEWPSILQFENPWQ